MIAFPIALRRAFLVLPLLMAACLPLRAQDAAEILLRLDRLEAENRRLNGQVEEMRFQVRRLEDQVKRFQTDTDFRFRDLESGRGGAPRPATPAAPAANGRRSDAFDPAQNPSAPGAPRQLGAPQPLPGGALPPGAQVSTDGGTANRPLDVTPPRPAQPPLAAAPGGDPKSDFEFAKSLVDRGDYELAEGAFRDFLKLHGKDRRVPDATYWLGESYLKRTRYREAAEHFLTVTSKYSNASRAPEAMIKLGVSLLGLGAKAEACGTFDQVTKKYPKASPGVRQAVDREKARAKC